MTSLGAGLQGRNTNNRGEIILVDLELLRHGLYIALFNESNPCAIPQREFPILAIPGPATKSSPKPYKRW